MLSNKVTHCWRSQNLCQNFLIFNRENNNILTILCKIIFIVRIVSLKVLMNKFSFYYVELNFEHMRTAGKYQSLGTQRW